MDSVSVRRSSAQEAETLVLGFPKERDVRPPASCDSADQHAFRGYLIYDISYRIYFQLWIIGSARLRKHLRVTCSTV